MRDCGSFVGVCCS